jgi:hypothetical protein
MSIDIALIQELALAGYDLDEIEEIVNASCASSHEDHEYMIDQHRNEDASERREMPFRAYRNEDGEPLFG